MADMDKELEKFKKTRGNAGTTLAGWLKKITGRGLNAEGKQVPDPVPMAPPIGYKRQPSLSEQIRQMVQSEHLAMAAREAGMETFEEAEDFDVGDDYEQMRSPWENEFDPPLSEIIDAGREALAAKQSQSDPAEPAGSPPGTASVPPTDGQGGSAGDQDGSPSAPKGAGA